MNGTHGSGIGPELCPAQVPQMARCGVFQREIQNFTDGGEVWALVSGLAPLVHMDCQGLKQVILWIKRGELQRFGKYLTSSSVLRNPSNGKTKRFGSEGCELRRLEPTPSCYPADWEGGLSD